ncbi:MAG: hypothetical protein FWB94_11375 [Chitinispirillia bacterium]|nr:hypothetical protein [Chitinispirillia bacterium]
MRFVKSQKIHPFCTGRNGFTIVELLVAAVLVLISVVAVVSVVRKSADMQVNDFHHRQARTVIIQYFETSFDSFRTTGYSVNGVTISNNITTYQPVPEMSITLDDRGGAPAVPLTGKISFRVVEGTESVTLAGAGPETVVFHEITIRVRWDDGGMSDSVVLTKRVAEI